MLLFLTSNWRLVSAVCVLDDSLTCIHRSFGDVLSRLFWIVPCPTDPTMITTTKKSIFVSLNFSNASPVPFVNGVELKNVGRLFFSCRYDSTVITLDVKLHPHFHCHWQLFVLMCHEAGQSAFLHTQLHLSTNFDHILFSNVSWH